VAIGTIDMAVWDAVAKIAGKPLFQLLADRYGNGQVNRKVFVYAAGGYYYPGKDDAKLKDEMRSYLDRGYNVVKMKIGGAPLAEDQRRIESVLGMLQDGQRLAVDANGRFDLDTAIAYAKALSPYGLFWYEEAGDPLDYELQATLRNYYPQPDGHRREPVLDAGRPQPDPPRRHARRIATGCSLTAPELRPGGVPAHAGHAARAWLVAQPLHPARRPPDVAGIAAGLGLGGNESTPTCSSPSAASPTACG
jgi:hypothetical protein